MTVKELAQKLSLKALCECDGSREINGCYAGDLLSWVMGRACEDNVWVTIMTNINVVAVALLADVSCVIVAENAEIEQSVVERAREKGINIFTSDKTIYRLCADISRLIEE